MKSDDTSKLKAIISKAGLVGFPYIFLLEELLNDNDETLFRSTLRNSQHVLCQLLPPPKQTGYDLRSRGHGLFLPELYNLNIYAKTLFIACCTGTVINISSCALIL